MGKGKVTITNTIRRQRFDADEMTQKDLAEKIGVTRQTVVAIEKPKYGPSLELPFRSPGSSENHSKRSSRSTSTTTKPPPTRT